MPSRNVYKHDIEQSYYHVYARGASRQQIFNTPADYHYFINLFARYLSASQHDNSAGRPYPHLAKSINLLSYCLMPNHFHLLLYQIERGAMAALMRSIMTSYSGHFNTTYGRSGQLLESRYRASLITSQSYVAT
jgi:putative transposase